jgi:hypothetical protein
MTPLDAITSVLIKPVFSLDLYRTIIRGKSMPHYGNFWGQRETSEQSKAGYQDNEMSRQHDLNKVKLSQ